MNRFCGYNDFNLQLFEWIIKPSPFLENTDERLILTIFGIFYTNDFSTRVANSGARRGFANVRLCYPLAAMCSHSCVANTSRRVLGLDQNFLVVVHASQTIKKGDKILFNYNDIMLPTIIRQKILKEVCFHKSKLCYLNLMYNTQEKHLNLLYPCKYFRERSLFVPVQGAPILQNWEHLEVP